MPISSGREGRFLGTALFVSDRRPGKARGFDPSSAPAFPRRSPSGFDTPPDGTEGGSSRTTRSAFHPLRPWRFQRDDVEGGQARFHGISAPRARHPVSASSPKGTPRGRPSKPSAIPAGRAVRINEREMDGARAGRPRQRRHRRPLPSRGRPAARHDGSTGDSPRRSDRGVGPRLPHMGPAVQFIG